MELIGLFLIFVVGIILLKVLLWFLKAGIFIITLPFKILFAVIALILVFLLIPTVVLTVLLAIVIPIIPFLLIGLGIILLIRYAT